MPKNFWDATTGDTPPPAWRVLAVAAPKHDNHIHPREYYLVVIEEW